MVPRTYTSHLSTVILPSSGILTFPTPPSPTSHTSYSLPPGSKFDSDLHWHEYYTEYFRITQGVMWVTLESPSGSLTTSYIGPGSGIVTIPRGRRHRIRRGDEGKKWEEWMGGVEWKEGGKISREFWEMEVRGEEWTEPGDGRKEVFFRNLSGLVGEKRNEGMSEQVMVIWGVLVMLREFDNWPAFLGGRYRTVEWVLSHVVLWVATVLGSLVGLRGWYEEYTPKELMKGKDQRRGRKDL